MIDGMFAASVVGFIVGVIFAIVLNPGVDRVGFIATHEAEMRRAEQYGYRRGLVDGRRQAYEDEARIRQMIEDAKQMTMTRDEAKRIINDVVEKGEPNAP